MPGQICNFVRGALQRCRLLSEGIGALGAHFGRMIKRGLVVRISLVEAQRKGTVERWGQW